MSAALRIKQRMTQTLQLNPYIERIFEDVPPEEPPLPPLPPPAAMDQGESPDVTQIVVATPMSFKPLPTLPTVELRQIIKLKLQTCFVGVLKQLDLLRQLGKLPPNRDETELAAHLLDVALRTTNTGVTAFALLQDQNLVMETVSPSQQLVSDRDLLVDQHVFDYAFWSLYSESRNTEDAQGDPMSRGRKWRDFMIRQRVNLFRLVNVQLLNIVECPLFQRQNKQLTQLLFNTVWCVCGIDNCRMMRDPAVWQETLNRMARCGRVLDDRPHNLLRVLRNLGVVVGDDELPLLHDCANFIAGVMLERYFESSFQAATPSLLYASLNDFDQAYVDGAKAEMCSGEGDLGCFRFVRWDKTRDVAMAWGTYYHRRLMQQPFVVSQLLNRRELAKLAKYVEMRLYAFLYFVGKDRVLLQQQVQFRLNDRMVRIDNHDGGGRWKLDLLKFAALAVGVMDSSWGVQALELLPLIAVDFDDDVSEHELAQMSEVERQWRHPSPSHSEHDKEEHETEHEQQIEQADQEKRNKEQKNEEQEPEPLDFDELFGMGLEEELPPEKPESRAAATAEELDEIFRTSPPPARERTRERLSPRERTRERLSPRERTRERLSPRERTRERSPVAPREERSPVRRELFEQSPLETAPKPRIEMNTRERSRGLFSLSPETEQEGEGAGMRMVPVSRQSSLI